MTKYPTPTLILISGASQDKIFPLGRPNCLLPTTPPNPTDPFSLFTIPEYTYHARLFPRPTRLLVYHTRRLAMCGRIALGNVWRFLLHRGCARGSLPAPSAEFWCGSKSRVWEGWSRHWPAELCWAAKLCWAARLCWAASYPGFSLFFPFMSLFSLGFLWIHHLVWPSSYRLIL